MGIELRPPRPRVQRFEESLVALRSLLDVGSITMDGPHHQLIRVCWSVAAIRPASLNAGSESRQPTKQTLPDAALGEMAQAIDPGDGDEALEDIARFVGHVRPATTAGYVRRLGRRPQAVAQPAGRRHSHKGSESFRGSWEQRWEHPRCTAR
jgi:hypothetical protein